MDTADDFTGPMNLGNPNEISMIELAEAVLRLCESKSKLAFKALPADDPKQRCPDIRLATATLGWKPKVSLDEGLVKTINYVKSQLAVS